MLYVAQNDDDTWHAEVLGTDTYSVEITLDGHTITDSFCDYPVENATCKHVVATFFALRETLKKRAKEPERAGGTGKGLGKSARASKKLTVSNRGKLTIISLGLDRPAFNPLREAYWQNVRNAIFLAGFQPELMTVAG